MNAAEPSPMPTPDLGALLRKPPQVTPVPAIPRNEPASAGPLRPSSAQIVVPPASRPAERRPVAKAPQTVTATSTRPYRRSIAVYLPRSVHRALQTQAEQRGTTATALILTAVNATHPLLAAPLTQKPARAGEDDLFDVPQNRRLDEPQVATTIRVTDAQYDALAELTALHGASRSAVIAAAVRLYLPTS